MDESDEVGGGIKNGDVLEDAEILSARSRLQPNAWEARKYVALVDLHDDSRHSKEGDGVRRIAGNLDTIQRAGRRRRLTQSPKSEQHQHSKQQELGCG